MRVTHAPPSLFPRPGLDAPPSRDALPGRPAKLSGLPAPLSAVPSIPPRLLVR